MRKCRFCICLFVSIAAGETLKFDESPTTYVAKKENVDHVLHFMAAQRIKMRQISSKGKNVWSYNYLQLSVRQSLSVCLSVCQSVSLSVCQSVCLSVCQFVCLSVSLSVCQSVCQSVSQSINQSVSQSVSQSVNRSISQSVNRSISQSVNQSLGSRLLCQCVGQTVSYVVNQCCWLPGQSVCYSLS